MGLWDATCAITRTPILSGDEVIVISLDPEAFRVSAAPGGRRISPFIFMNSDLVNKAVRGHYDRSGWIDEEECQKEMYEDVRVFFSAAAWDRVCDFCNMDSGKGDLVEEFAVVCSFLSLTRRDVLCETFHGQQIRDQEQVEAYDLIAQLTVESAEQFRKAMRDEG